jgi:hypothetical protein
VGRDFFKKSLNFKFGQRRSQVELALFSLTIRVETDLADLQ